MNMSELFKKLDKKKAIELYVEIYKTDEWDDTSIPAVEQAYDIVASSQHKSEDVLSIKTSIDEDDGETYVSCNLISARDGETYAYELRTITINASLNINEDSLKTFNEYEIAVHFLWEATWSGFTDECIIERGQRLCGDDYEIGDVDETDVEI